MNPETVKFRVDISPNYAFISIGGVLVKIIFKKYIPLPLQEASNIIIKSNGDVIKCRYSEDNPYLLSCIERIRSGEDLLTYTFETEQQVRMFIQEKMKSFHEIREFLELIKY